MAVDPAPPAPPKPPHAVQVSAPGRLHLGFLDPSGSLGRRFGSLGLVIDGVDTVVELRPAARPKVSAQHASMAPERDRAGAHLAALQRATGRAAPLHLHLQALPPAHAGFGSGTQLALAIGRAFAALHGLDLPTPAVAQLLGRGLRSGIGIAGFDQGGLLLDGGPGRDDASGSTQPAPLLSRIALPAAWRVVLVLDPRQRGLSGTDEKAALAALPAFEQAQAAAVCHEVLMRVLPGAASDDFALFAAGVSSVQRLVGQHFAPAQHGSLYASRAVARVCEWIGRQQPAGIGQSSWGPTGFAIVADAAAAQTLLAGAQAAGVVDPALVLKIVTARAHGAVVTHPPIKDGSPMTHTPAGADQP